MKFSLKRKEIKLVIEGEDGNDRNYTLREITGRDRDKFTTKLASKTKYDSSGKAIGIVDTTGLFPELLSMSLFDEKDVLVDFKVCELFPAEMQQELFEVSQRLSGLTKESETKAGND